MSEPPKKKRIIPSMNTCNLNSPCGLKQTITNCSKNFTKRLRNSMARPRVAPAAIRESISLCICVPSFSSSDQPDRSKFNCQQYYDVNFSPRAVVAFWYRYSICLNSPEIVFLVYHGGQSVARMRDWAIADVNESRYAARTRDL